MLSSVAKENPTEPDPPTSEMEEGTPAPEGKDKPHYIYDTLVNKGSQRLALLCLIASFLLPLDGGGFTICWFYNLFELPCPGCGLGRSVTNVSHLDLGAAFEYHPWGIPLYALILFLAFSNFFPKHWIDATRKWMIERENRARWFYWTFIGTFLIFGFARLGYLVVASAH